MNQSLVFDLASKNNQAPIELFAVSTTVGDYPLSAQIEHFQQEHWQWLIYLRDMLDGRLRLKQSDPGSQYECALGRWSYTTGYREFGDWPEFEAIERPHTCAHSIARSALAACNRGELQPAEAAFRETQQLLQAVADALDKFAGRAAVIQLRNS